MNAHEKEELKMEAKLEADGYIQHLEKKECCKMISNLHKPDYNFFVTVEQLNRVLAALRTLLRGDQTPVITIGHRNKPGPEIFDEQLTRDLVYLLGEHRQRLKAELKRRAAEL